MLFCQPGPLFLGHFSCFLLTTFISHPQRSPCPLLHLGDPGSLLGGTGDTCLSLFSTSDLSCLFWSSALSMENLDPCQNVSH